MSPVAAQAMAGHSSAPLPLTAVSPPSDHSSRAAVDGEPSGLLSLCELLQPADVLSAGCLASRSRVPHEALPETVKEQHPSHRRKRNPGGPGKAHQHDHGHGPQVPPPHDQQQRRGQQEEVQGFRVGHLQHRRHGERRKEHGPPERRPVRGPVAEQSRRSPASCTQAREHRDERQGRHAGPMPVSAGHHPSQRREQRIEGPGVFLDVPGLIRRQLGRVPAGR